LAYGFEAGEAVDDLGAELGVGVFACLCGSDFDFDAVFLGDAGNVGPGGFAIRGYLDAVDEAEVDYVAGEGGVVAVAKGDEDVGFGEHLFLMITGGTPLPAKSVQSPRFRYFRVGLCVKVRLVKAMRCRP
jgi:hypothetical protein